MSKRRITKRQKERITESQAERRRQAEQIAAEASVEPGQLGPQQQGLVIARYGASVAVEDRNQHVNHCQLRQHLTDIVVGDKVVWQAGPHDTGVVVAINPRQSVLGRLDRLGHVKPIAANITQIMITVAPQPAVNFILLDSYLALAEILAVPAVIVINKVDLLGSDEAACLAALKRYDDLSYPIVWVSTYAGEGLKILARYLRGNNSVFVGQSGVGKSSIIAHFLPDQGITVGALMERSGKGSHTTSTTRLYHLPRGGELIDSPGIRELSLTHLTAQQIEKGFIEFRPFLGHCKFRNCSHAKEPGCALQAAAKAGTIHLERLENFHKIIAMQPS